jgi:hypothetical protein
MASCAPTGTIGGLGTIQAIRACCSEAIIHDRTHAHLPDLPFLTSVRTVARCPLLRAEGCCACSPHGDRLCTRRRRRGHHGDRQDDRQHHLPMPP